MADIFFRYFKLIHQDIFDRFFTLARIGDGLIDLFLGQNIIFQQIIELGGPGFCHTLLVIQRNPQYLGQLGDRFPIKLCKGTAVGAVDKLNGTQQKLFEDDGNNQNLFGDITGFLIPAFIKFKIRINGRYFFIIINVFDIDELLLESTAS